MAGKKENSFGDYSPAKQKAATEKYQREQAEKKATKAQSDKESIARSRDPNIKSKPVDEVDPQHVLGGKENADRTEKKTKEIKLLASQSGNMAAIDKMIASQD